MRMRKAAGTVAALVLLVSLLTTGCAVKPVINDDPESVGAGRPSSSAGTTNAPDNTDPTAPTDTTASTESTDASRPTGSTTANAGTDRPGGATTTTSSQGGGDTQPTVSRVKAQVKTVNGMPRLFIDGKVSTGNMFFVNGDQGASAKIYESQIRYAKEAGLHLYSTNANINYTYKESTDRNLVFASLRSRLQTILNADPDAKIMLRVAVGPMAASSFGQDDAAVYSGTKSGNASLASDVWFAEAEKRLMEMIAYIRNSPEFADHVYAYHLENWEWFDPNFTVSPDTSPTNSRKFREWLKNKYGTDAKLQAAWGQGYTLSEAQVPEDLPLNSTTGDTVMLKATDSRYTDYLDYWNWLTASRIEQLAKAVKQASSNENLALAFYGYYFEQYHATTGHWAFDKLLNSPYLDGFASPTSYMDRGFGRNSALATSGYMTTADTVTRAGKLWYMESDQRTFINRTDREFNVDDDAPLPGLKTIEDIQEVHKREVGMAMIHGTCLYPMDLAGLGWYDYDDIWTNFMGLDAAYAAYAQALKKQPSFDVALVVDEKAQCAVGSPAALSSVSLAQMMLEIYRSGLSFSLVEMQDVLNGKADDCSMYVFANPYRLSSADIDALSKKLHTGNKTSVFLYSLGTASSADMKKLTGMEMETINQVKSHAIQLTSQTKIPGLDVPRGLTANPLTVVQGSYTTALGTYADGSVGYALYEGTNYRSVFLGSHFASAQTLRAIAKTGGVQVYMDGNDVLNANDTMLMFSASSAGSRTVRFGEKTDVYDYFTGKWYTGVTSVTFENMKAGQVKWLFFGKKAEIQAMKLPAW